MRSSDDVVGRLRYIREEILYLLSEARDLIKNNANSSTYDQAKSYWIAHIETSLSEETDYLASSMCTMERTINKMEEELVNGED